MKNILLGTLAFVALTTFSVQGWSLTCDLYAKNIFDTNTDMAKVGRIDNQINRGELLTMDSDRYVITSRFYGEELLQVEQYVVPKYDQDGMIRILFDDSVIVDNDQTRNNPNGYARSAGSKEKKKILNIVKNLRNYELVDTGTLASGQSMQVEVTMDSDDSSTQRFIEITCN